MGGAGSALMEACHHWQTTNAEGWIIVVSNNENNGIAMLSVNVNMLELNFSRLEGRRGVYLQVIGKQNDQLPAIVYISTATGEIHSSGDLLYYLCYTVSHDSLAAV